MAILFSKISVNSTPHKQKRKESCHMMRPTIVRYHFKELNIGNKSGR